MSINPFEPFWDACGATAPFRLVIRRPDASDVVVPLYQPFVVVGRDPSADLPLADPTVSRRHAYLQVIHGRLFCYDFQSRSGTHWADGPRRRGWVGPEGVRVGAQTLLWLQEDAAGPQEDWDPLTQPWPGGQPLPTISFDFPAAAPRPPRWRMARTLALLGSSPECRVSLRSDNVSRFDCGLVRTPAGVWVVDLLGRGQVRLNGQPVRLALLQSDDRLDVGEFPILVHAEHPEPPPKGEVHTTLPPAEPPARVPPPEPASLPPPPEPAAEVHRREHGAPTLPDLPPAPARWAPPALVDEGDATAAPVLAMISQFGALQQMMFGQFQQTMLVMSQMFSTLHQDQMEVIREELARLHELTQELHTLKAQLAGAGAGPDAANGRPALPSPGPRPHAPRPPVVPKPLPTDPSAPLPSGHGAEDIHAWLCQRMENLQEERQGRWQKILSFLGKKEGEVPPD